MRLAVLVLLVASCRQVFGLHELADKKDAGSAAGDGRLDAPRDASGDGRIDAPADAAIDAGNRVESIQCGTGSACDPTVPEVCCSSSSDHHCIDLAGSCFASQAILHCDDASDCSTGKFCCASYDSTMTVSASVCTPENAPCSQPSGGGILYFCDPAAANPCPTSYTRCTAQVTLFGVPPGYYYCQ